MATPARLEYMRAYQQTEAYKIKNRALAKKHRQIRKRKSTQKRIQEHTMDELMAIVVDTCAAKGVDYDTIKEQYEAFMRFLHDPAVSPDDPVPI